MLEHFIDHSFVNHNEHHYDTHDTVCTEHLDFNFH